MAHPDVLYTLAKVAFYRKLANLLSGEISGAPMQASQNMQQGMLRQAEGHLQSGVQKFKTTTDKANQKAQEMVSRITGEQQGPPQQDQQFQQMASGMGHPLGGNQ